MNAGALTCSTRSVAPASKEISTMYGAMPDHGCPRLAAGGCSQRRGPHARTLPAAARGTFRRRACDASQTHWTCSTPVSWRWHGRARRTCWRTPSACFQRMSASPTTHLTPANTRATRMIRRQRLIRSGRVCGRGGLCDAASAPGDADAGQHDALAATDRRQGGLAIGDANWVRQCGVSGELPAGPGHHRKGISMSQPSSNNHSRERQSGQREQFAIGGGK